MIKELIDEFYKTKKTEKEKTTFFVSDAGKCPRAIWFSLKNYPKKEIDARVMRIFEHGDHTHMRILGVLFSLGLVNAVEIEIPNNELIHGRADAIINIKGEPYVVEIKSVNAARFKKESPDEDHVKQLQLYLYFFKIKKGILIYENKDTQELKEFLINYDENIVKKIFSEFNKLKEFVDKNIVPEIPKDLEDWRCDYCPYIEECEKIEEQKLKNEGNS
ncbi:MAG: CRISPR-associated protein Cas4 [Candidatus Pacearchaeota archaeon]